MSSEHFPLKIKPDNPLNIADCLPMDLDTPGLSAKQNDGTAGLMQFKEEVLLDVPDPEHTDNLQAVIKACPLPLLLLQNIKEYEDNIKEIKHEQPLDIVDCHPMDLEEPDGLSQENHAAAGLMQIIAEMLDEPDTEHKCNPLAINNENTNEDEILNEPVNQPGTSHNNTVKIADHKEKVPNKKKAKKTSAKKKVLGKRLPTVAKKPRVCSGPVSSIIFSVNGQALDDEQPSTSARSLLSCSESSDSSNMSSSVPTQIDVEEQIHLLTRMMISTLRPYSFADCESFKHLIQFMAPDFVIPSSATFAETIIPGHLKKMKTNLKDILLKSPFIALAVNEWTLCDNCQFLEVTCSILNDEFQIKMFTLTCKEIYGSLAAADMAYIIIELLEEFNICKSKVVAITADSKNPVEVQDFTSIPCFAKAVKFIASEILDHKNIAPTLIKVGAITKQMDSSFAEKFLKPILKNFNKRRIDVPWTIDDECPWSKLREIEYVDGQQDVLTEFLNTYSNGKYRSLIIDDNEHRLLAALKPLLAKLEKFEEVLSSETQVTSSAVLRSIHDIQKILESISDPALLPYRDHLKELSTRLDNIFNTFGRKSIEMATYFDLRFDKPKDHTSTERMIRMIAADIDPTATKMCGFDGEHDEDTIFNTLFGQSPELAQMTSLNKIDEELRRYSCEMKLPLRIDISDWWNNRKAIYPILSQIARKYLCIPATCAPTKRAFTKSEEFMEDLKLRTPYDQNYPEELVFLAKNMEKIPFK